MATVNTGGLLSVDEALDRILSAFSRLPAETIDLADGLNRVLTQDARSEINLPPFANSSMDGYAVRAADLVGASKESPARLQVVADIPAGTAPTVTIGSGQAARIMTGAPMPDGADAVVPVEQTDDDPRGLNSGDRLAAPPPDHIGIFQPVKSGDYVRPAGEDVTVGQLVLREGRVLRAADLGMLAALGLPKISVIRQPVVAILSTGDELLTPDQPLTAGKIRDTNSYTIAALAEQLGAKVLRLGIARDTIDDVQSRLEQAVSLGADLIISSAGVSVGAFDVVKTVIESLGAIGFWKVNMRPGKPLAFGNVRGVPFMGLPGNPVSAMVSFDVFARPAILTLAGRDLFTAMTEAELAESITSDGRRSYLRVTLQRESGRLIARTTGNQSSGVLTSLVNADGLLIVSEGLTEIHAGTRLPVRLFTDTI
jgi:molybdopterin molybdotransferase